MNKPIPSPELALSLAKRSRQHHELAEQCVLAARLFQHCGQSERAHHAFAQCRAHLRAARVLEDAIIRTAEDAADWFQLQTLLRIARVLDESLRA